MPEDPASQFKTAFIARTKAAREDRRFTQAQMADLLGIAQDKYKQYEKRSMLPHVFLERFCLITGVDLAWMFTGRAATTPAAKSRRPRRAKKPSREIRAA